MADRLWSGYREKDILNTSFGTSSIGVTRMSCARRIALLSRTVPFWCCALRGGVNEWRPTETRIFHKGGGRTRRSSSGSVINPDMALLRPFSKRTTPIVPERQLNPMAYRVG